MCIKKYTVTIISFFNIRFYAISNTDWGYIPAGPITFDSKEFDYSGNFNISTGIFKSPKDGLYSFSFNGQVADRNKYGSIYVYINGSSKQFFYYSDATTAYSQNQMTPWWTLDLKKDNEVYLNNNHDNSFYISQGRQMFFMGYLVK